MLSIFKFTKIGFLRFIILQLICISAVSSEILQDLDSSKPRETLLKVTSPSLVDNLEKENNQPIELVKTAKLNFYMKEIAFQQLLNQDILPYLRQKNLKTPSCFISYAWGNEDHEHWVEKFAQMLEKAGIEVFLDRWENNRGKVLTKFTNKIENSDWAIVIGTKLYLEKTRKKPDPNTKEPELKSEVQLIEYFVGYNSQRNDRVIPVLLEGTPEESLPFMLRHKIASDFTPGKDYFQELLNLIHDLYGIDNRDEIFEGFFKKLKVYLFEIDNNVTALERRQYQERLEKEELARKSKISQEVVVIKEKLLKELLSISRVWNLPRQDNKFYGRERLLNELHLRLDPRLAFRSTNNLAICVCAGLGGVGKTQLALQYIRHTKQPYTLKAWFYAGDLTQLQQKYLEFSKYLGYKGEKNKIIEAIEFVNQWFQDHPGWLLVFDNAERYEDIGIFLPKQGGSILITTPNIEWPTKIDILPVNLMEETEAIELVKKLTLREDAEIKNLVATLGYLPLALAQASAYIREKHKTVAQYLKLYEQHEQALLADKSLPTGATHVPVAVTWNTSLSTIEAELKKENKPLLARILLTVCAYVAPANIPINVLLSWLENTYPNIKEHALILDELLGKLKRYSLITLDPIKQSVSLHPLVQSVLRYQHAAQKKSTKEFPKLTPVWYMEVIDAIDAEFWRKTHPIEDTLRQKSLFPHIQMLERHYQTIFKSSEKRSELSFRKLLYDIGYVLLYMLDNAKEAKPYFERALEIEEKKHVKNNVEIGNILTSLGKIYRSLGDENRAKSSLERALSIKERYYGENHAEITNTLTYLGLVYKDLGYIKQAKELLERALVISENYYGKDHIAISRILTYLGIVYSDLGDTGQSRKVLEQALSIEERHYGKNNFGLGCILTYLGDTYRDLGNTQYSKKLLEHALSIKEQHYDKDHFEVAITLSSLGETHRHLGNANLSKELLERALSIEKQHYGEGHFEVAVTLTRLGNACRDLGEITNAKKSLEHALEIKEILYGKYHPEVANTLTHLGIACNDVSDFKKAKELLERALIIREQQFGKTHFQTAQTLTCLASIYRDLGEVRQAKELLDRALTIRESYYGKDHFEVASTLVCLGNVSQDLGYLNQAKEYLERALIIREKYYGKDHFEVASVLNHLGSVYGALGDFKEAKKYLKRSLNIKELYYGEDHIEVAKTLFNLMEIHMKLEEFLIAYPLAQRCYYVFSNTQGIQPFYIEKAMDYIEKSKKGIGDKV